MIVVDVNVVSYSLVNGPKTGEARGVQSKDPEWIVPVFWRYEFLNVLNLSVRHGFIRPAAAETAWRDAVRLLEPAEQPVHSIDSLHLAVDGKISVYDAQYVTLARSLGLSLVTEDRELLRKFPDLAISMKDFAA